MRSVLKFYFCKPPGVIGSWVATYIFLINKYNNKLVHWIHLQTETELKRKLQICYRLTEQDLAKQGSIALCCISVPEPVKAGKREKESFEGLYASSPHLSVVGQLFLKLPSRAIDPLNNNLGKC